MTTTKPEVSTDPQQDNSIPGGRVWHKLRRIARSLLIIYALTCVAMIALERYLVYPIPPSAEWSPHDPTIEEVRFEAEDGTKLLGFFFGHPNPQCSILYCHGNGEDVSHNGPLMAHLRDSLQASILLFDYRGYGESEGSPYEAGLIQDGLAAQAWLAEKMNIAPQDTVIWGRSLGGGVAVAVAQQRGARALVLQNTFHDMSEVAANKFPWLPVRWMMRNRYPSVERIKQYEGPLLQCHGSADRVIPLAMGKQLFTAAPSKQKRFIKIPGGGHNDPTSGVFLEALAELLKTLPVSAGGS